jgi:hypothetical protein
MEDHVSVSDDSFSAGLNRIVEENRQKVKEAALVNPNFDEEFKKLSNAKSKHVREIQRQRV